MRKLLFPWLCVFVILIGLFPAVALGTGESINALTDTYGDGLVVFSSKKKYGYMDIFGNTVIKPSYISANPFHNGMALVQTSGSGRYAQDQFINTSGKAVIKAPKKTKTRYYGLCDYWDMDNATVQIWSINKKDGSISPIGFNYINEKGKLLNEEEYQYAGAFHEGLALVGTGYSFKRLTRMSMANDHWLGYFDGNTSVRASTDYYYIDKDGKRIGNMTWALGRDFKEGMAAVAIKAGNNLHWGFIDSKGALRVTPEYSKVGDFSNGLAWVSDGERVGYIDNNGDIVVPLSWKEATNFDSDGYAVVYDEYHAKLIDKTGNIVLDTDYTSIGTIKNSDHYLVYDGFARGMIDRSGNVLIPMAYHYTGYKDNIFYGTRYDDTLMICNEFGDLITPVIKDSQLISKEQASAYPDKTPCKKIVLPVDAGDNSMKMCLFTDQRGDIISINLIDNFRGEEFSLSRSNGKTIIFDLNGNQIGNQEWDGFLSGPSNEYIACVKKGDFYGFVDAKTGKTIQTPQFTSVKNADDGTLVAMMGKNATYLDNRGRTILPTITNKTGKEEIKALQQRLSDLGYYSNKVDGKYSKNLTEAINKAKEALGMKPDGIADSYFQYAIAP